jgi:hypothetical protein
MFVFSQSFLRACMCVCMYVSERERVCVCVCVCVLMCRWVCMQDNVFLLKVCAEGDSARKHRHTGIHIHTYTRTHILTHTNTQTHTHPNRHTHTLSSLASMVGSTRRAKRGE